MKKGTLEEQNPNQVENDLVSPDFINYIFQEGTKEQKRELISCLNTTLYLEDKRIILDHKVIYEKRPDLSSLNLNKQ